MTGRNHPRIDLYRETIYLFTDVQPALGNEWRWRMWKGSRIVGASSESYIQRASALRNLETVLGAVFDKTSTPDQPEPFGVLYRGLPHDKWGPDCGLIEVIPVRLRVSS